MIEKKDESSSPSSCTAELTSPAASVVQSHQVLQLTTCEVQAKLRESFARLTEALRSREKQLLRQVEVLHSQQIALLQTQQSQPDGCISDDIIKPIPQVTVDIDQEKSLCESILSFGKVDVEGGSLVAIDGNMAPFSVPYRVEDYQDANEDHVCLYKPLSNQSTPQVVRFRFSPRLKDYNELQQLKLEGSTHDIDLEEPSYVDDQASTTSQEAVCGSFISDVHTPSQIQQWLQEIMAETEIEPSVGEQEKNFTSIRLSEEPTVD